MPATSSKSVLLGRHAEHAVDQPLADEGVGALAQTGGEQLGNVLQADSLPVDQVFVITVAISAA